MTTMGYRNTASINAKAHTIKNFQIQDLIIIKIFHSFKDILVIANKPLNILRKI